jgi:hypothetical protein
MIFRYTIETATVTSVVSRIVWPSTITTVTFVECTPRPSISRIPPMGPSMALVPPPMALSTAGVQSKNKRQVIVSTTVHQTRIIYAASMLCSPDRVFPPNMPTIMAFQTFLNKDMLTSAFSSNCCRKCTMYQGSHQLQCLNSLYFGSIV